MDMRIGGLASGMDIDKLVGDLMKAERIPLDKLNQDKQLLEWKRDDYRSMNRLLKELDEFIFEGIFRKASFLAKTTTSSNEGAVTATAGNTAAATSTNIEVQNLATSAVYSSETTILDNNGAPVDADANLENITFQNGQVFSGGFSLKLGIIKPGETAASPVEIKVDPSTDSINDVMAKINSNTSLGVAAFYDKATNKIVLTMKDTGAGGQVILDDATTTDFFQAMGFTSASSGTDLSGKTAGQDAQFTYNGYATTRSSNTFTINDVTYTLKQKTTGPVNLSVKQDTGSILDTIVKFVGKYNETIEKINGELDEKRYRNYAPLTDQEREDLDEREIELWEEKAKSGMLRNDPLLSGGLNEMRINLYTPVTGANVSTDYNQLAEIGITTSSNYRDGGKLVIDEEKLRAAIGNDPNAVYELFMSNGTTTNEKGIARRLRDSISDTMEKIEARAGNTLKTNQQFTMGRNLNDLETRITDFERRLIGIEDRYWRQFTAMEKAIGRMNQQSMFLMNQFGG